MTKENVSTEKTPAEAPDKGVGCRDLFSEATNALKAWDELTDTTHPRAFGRMKDAMEKLRDAVEDHEADEVGRCVDAMTPEQVNAYLASMGVNLEELRAHTEEMRTKIETKLGKPDALAQARCGLADAKLTIKWQAKKLEDARRVLERVAKHADFSQCLDGVEEEVDAALSSLNGAGERQPAEPLKP